MSNKIKISLSEEGGSLIVLNENDRKLMHIKLQKEASNESTYSGVLSKYDIKDFQNLERNISLSIHEEQR